MLITSPTTLVSRVDLVVREKGGDFSQNWPLRWQHVTHFLSYAFAKYGNISKIFFFSSSLTSKSLDTKLKTHSNIP